MPTTDYRARGLYEIAVGFDRVVREGCERRAASLQQAPGFLLSVCEAWMARTRGGIGGHPSGGGRCIYSQEDLPPRSLQERDAGRVVDDAAAQGYHHTSACLNALKRLVLDVPEGLPAMPVDPSGG